MVYKKYGEAFKEIRLHKDMSLGELEYISGVSKSTLSQFENGKLMLSFDKLDRALDAMYVTLQDYHYVLNEGHTHYAISQFNKIQSYFLEKRYDEIAKIYESNLKNAEKGTDLIALCAKICYSPLREAEVKQIESYFTSGLEWSLYDIGVLSHLLGQLDLDTLLDVLEEFFLNTFFLQYIDELATYRNLVTLILIRSSLIFIKHHKRLEAEQVILKLKYFAQKSDINAKLGLYFVRGCYQYTFISKHKGQKIVKQLSMILEDIKATNLQSLMWEYFQNEIIPFSKINYK